MSPFPYRIVAHRGAREKTFENSMASIKEAFAKKADVVELDVRMTRDKGFIILHDYFLERTTSGTGWAMTSRMRDFRNIQLLNGDPVPSLEEVLAYMQQRKSGELLLDVKDMMVGFFDAKRFVRLLRDYDMVHRTVVSSYNPLTLHRIRRREALLDLSLLTISPYGIAVPLAKKLGARYVSCIFPIAKEWQARYFSALLPTENFISWAKTEGLETIAYWEHGEHHLEWLMHQGVSCFMSNKPDVLRTELQRLHKRK